MERKTVIVLITPFNEFEVKGSLKKVCKSKGWNYNILSRKKFPFDYEGYGLYKVLFD